MAIQQVIASIAVQVQNSQALNNLASGYRAVGQAAQNAQANMNNFAQNANNANRQATAFTGSITRLTQSMVLFSVLLPIVRLPQTVIRSFQDMVDVGMEWEHQIRSINSLLALNDQGYNQLNTTMKGLAATYGLTTDEVGQAGKQIASTLGVISRNTAGMTDAQRAQDDYNTSMAMMDKIAKLSRASFEDMNTVTEAAFSIMATGRLTLDQADDAFNELFKTVQIGRSTFAQFNQDAGKFVPLAEDWIQTADNATDRFSRLTGVLNVFATASNSLGSARAATGVGRMFQAIAGTSTQQQQMIAQLENFRKRMGYGQEYNITPQALFATGDTQQMIQRLWNVLGPQSPIITQQINNLRRRGRLQDEGAAREALAQQLQKKYFEQVQAVRAFQATTPQALEEMTRAREAAPGEQAAYEQYLKDPLSAVQRMQSAWMTLKDGVFQGIARDIIRLNMGLTDLFANISKGLADESMAGKNLGERMQYIFTSIGEAFTKWYQGGGKTQVQSWGMTIGLAVSQGIADFFSGDTGKSAAADAAKTFLAAFGEGIKENAPQMLGNVLSSSIPRALASFMLFRRLGVPLLPAAAGAAATTALPSGGPGSMAATAGIAGLAALWPMLGLAGGRAGAGAMGSAILGARGAGLLGGLRGVAGRAGLGISLGLGALDVASALTGPEQGKGQALGSAIGGTAGSVLGALLGGAIAGGTGGIGLLAIPALAMAGGAAGGALGGAAGDWIQNTFFGQQAGAIAQGSGMGPEQVMALADTFALGVNNSDAVTQLEQINRKMDRPGNALTGGSVRPGGTNLGAAGTGAPGAPGSLEQAFVNQFDPTSPLTKSQADAACGPAAVAFFAKAYGRNPTLAEAYALQSKLQGADISTTGGSNIVQMGAAIQQLGAPAGEIYQGANIDWGRLAENAKAGIPGIVNIGPNSKTGWPGHFFQIGGYNPENNTFMVGSSGTNLRGGSAWMTPQQMTAFGPAFGAIYGTAATNLGGGRTPGGARGTGAGGVDPGIIYAISRTETGASSLAKGEMTLGIGTAARSGAGSSGMIWGSNTPNAAAVGQPGSFWAYKSQDEAAEAFKNYITANMPDLAPYLGNSQQFFQKMIDTQSNYYVPMKGEMSKTAYYQRWMNMAAGAGTGTGMGPGGGGGAISVNGNLIGTVILGGGATQDDADALAAMIADALENLMNTTGGGTLGQNKQFKS